MICRACGLQPARVKPKPGRGPVPTLCEACGADAGRPQSLARERASVAEAEARHQRRVPVGPHAAPCTCAALIVRMEGPLLVCGLCSREIAAPAVTE
jgi:hypothetical protein